MPGGSDTKLNLGGGQDKATDATVSEILLDNFMVWK